ncbi:hypothetical protein Dimus_004995 [Dionaea muscipula]
MAFASLLLEIPSSTSHCCYQSNLACDGCRRHHFSPPCGGAVFPPLDTNRRSWIRSRVLICCRSGSDRSFIRRWRLNASTLRVFDGNANGQISALQTIEIPVTCYHIIGVPHQAEKDQIVKSVMDLKNAEIEEGYTMESVTSRQDLLMDVRDKLLFEPEYAGNKKENILPKSSLRIPWAWLPGALCLLQEAGEAKLVIDIGRAALQYPNAKPYAHDLLLSMALAECAVAKTHFEKNHISQGFEALAHAQRILRSEISLGKMKLLSQIEESLEELTPACTLELLGMPPSTDNAERRQGAIAALGGLLRQSLDVISLCHVYDWPSFLSQALGKLMAVEIVELLPWDKLAITRKNKKSIECQNQRAVVDFDCFYTVLIAHIALGFSSRQKDLIRKAKALGECLMASEGIDLKFEEALCVFLLGQGDEAEIEKLHHLKLGAKYASQNSALTKQSNEVSLPSPSLEMWLKDAVLGIFSDTRDCSPSLAKYFGRDKKALDTKQNRGASQILPGVSQRQLYRALSSEGRVLDGCPPSQHLGPAIKQQAPSNLPCVLQETKASNQSDMTMTSSQFKRDLGSHHRKEVESWLMPKYLVERITFVAVLGCIVVATFKLLGLHSRRLIPSQWIRRTSQIEYSSFSNHRRQSSTVDGIKNLFSLVVTRLWNPSNAGNHKRSRLTASLSSTLPTLCSRVMPVEEAEALVRQWQAIKAEALGPNHQVHLLSDVLEDPMLHQVAFTGQL